MSEAARQESAARSSREIRAALDHPVIDADGHIIEFLPAVRDFLVEEGGRELASAFDEVLGAAGKLDALSVDERRAMGLFKLTWWPYPCLLYTSPSPRDLN